MESDSNVREADPNTRIMGKINTSKSDQGSGDAVINTRLETQNQSHPQTNEDAIDWKEEDGDDEDARLELGLVGKIWIKRIINANAFMTTIKNIWQPTHGISISSIGENTFVFQFHNWRDKMRVVEDQPWHFDRHAILLSDITDYTKPSRWSYLNFRCG